jgi:hypothetical protein
MFRFELVNRSISIPHCIWCNFTYEKDCCRFIVYDDQQSISEVGGGRKLYNESYGFKKVAFFNCFRDSSLNGIEYLENLNLEQREEVERLLRQNVFTDFTDVEKEDIRMEYANHIPNHSLMLYKDCSQEEKLAILSRLVFENPHPTGENGMPIPLFRDSGGSVKAWPFRDGKPISVYELG